MRPATEHAEQGDRIWFSAQNCLEFVDGALDVWSRSSRPLHFDSEFKGAPDGKEVKSLLVTDFGVGDAWAFVLAFDGEATSREDSEYRLVEDVLAERPVHIACREVANIRAQPALDSVEHIG